jgi:hypothetical protein
LSIISSQSEQSVGEKGGSISDHDEVNDSDSKDPTYNPPADFDDNDLFYSKNEDLDATFDRGLDEIARVIEYADPKKPAMDGVARQLFWGVLHNQTIQAWMTKRRRTLRRNTR